MSNHTPIKVHSVYIESNIIKLISKIIGGFFYGIGWIIGKIILLALWFTVSMIALITLGLWLSNNAPEHKPIKHNARAEQSTTTTCK